MCWCRPEVEHVLPLAEQQLAIHAVKIEKSIGGAKLCQRNAPIFELLPLLTKSSE